MKPATPYNSLTVTIDVQFGDNKIESQKFFRIPSDRSRPFFWNAASSPGYAPTGWYRWTDGGLVYLGESILERA